MPCDKTALLEFLEVLNDDLTKKVTLNKQRAIPLKLLKRFNDEKQRLILKKQ